MFAGKLGLDVSRVMVRAVSLGELHTIFNLECVVFVHFDKKTPQMMVTLFLRT